MWTQLDEDADGILETALTGPAYRKIKEQFGPFKQRGQPQPPPQPDRRKGEVHHLGRKIKGLNMLFKTSSPAEIEGVKNLTSKKK